MNWPNAPTAIDREHQHEGTEHLAVNDTKSRRRIVRIGLKTTARLYCSHGICRQISNKLIVKASYRTHLTEAATLQFLAENTSIPVPKVYSAFLQDGIAYIVMHKVEGKELPDVWAKLAEDERTSIWQQLKDMFNELRSLNPPSSTAVQSCVGGSLHDIRIPHGLLRFGPFDTVNDFHVWLRQDFKLSNTHAGVEDQERRELQDMIQKQDGGFPPPVFTHGDLNPSNIFVKNGKISGIIDWEFAGWYPHYWEYTTAWYGGRLRTDWQEDLKRFLEPYPEELEMEIVRNKWWGDL